MRIQIALLFTVCLVNELSAEPPRPNIVLVMADDQGWGQVSYIGHPNLKTPHLDAMAAAGLRFNRFYAAGPVCSPTRASVLTGRTHRRTGVPTHGHNLCLQEKTLPRALQKAGYATAHFGKWHLNGIRGAGVPILKEDANHPGHYGFDHWLSVTNFFDLDPLMSRVGQFEEFKGDSSEVIVAEALKYITLKSKTKTPFFTVIWYGSPHSPMRALEKDRKNLPEGKVGEHLGEIVGIDRSIGMLRTGLRNLNIENNTLVWYCSDNGGLNIDPHACGHLKGHKGDVYEGGIRVPGIIEWPGHIEPRITDEPASTMDIMPTIVDLLDLPDESMLSVRDGESIVPMFNADKMKRKHPIPFCFQRKAAFVDGELKLLSTSVGKDKEWKLFNLKDDPSEKNNLSDELPQQFERMKKHALKTLASIEDSAVGKDYPEGKVVQPPRNAFWHTMKEYKPHFEEFFKRPEYSGMGKKVPKNLR